jgi:ABC-type cobalamin/Fe3+-siderophores transport system ATPase subunit
MKDHIDTFELVDKISILTGLNGCGKTTYLKKIYEKFKPKALLLEMSLPLEPLKISIAGLSPCKAKLFKELVDYEFDPARSFSAGEYRYIYMMYNLIFNTDNIDYVLIDDPETSLHISLQLKFLDNLKTIMEVCKINFAVIATHSPQIINSEWENVRETKKGKK